MIVRRFAVAITTFQFVQSFVVANDPHAIRQESYPACLDLVQYGKGLCCLPGKPCPSPTGSIASLTGTSILPTQMQTGDTAAVSVHATIAYTQTINEDGTTGTLAVIQGGAVTAPITLPSAPQNTLDLSGDIVSSSVFSIASTWRDNLLPLASSWAQTPEPAKATAAIQAIDNLLPQIGSLANNLPNGIVIFDCPGGNAEGELVDQLQAVNCEGLSLLSELEKGQTTTDPIALKPITDAVLADANKIATELDGIAGKSEDSGNIIGSSTTFRSTSGTYTSTSVVGLEPTPTSTAPVQPTTQLLESLLSTTITSLPVGAFIQTLTGGFTEGTIITTTYSGSNDPTVIPVVVPIGGPPQIVSQRLPFHSFKLEYYFSIPLV